mmetsp:Transcript_16691/g.56712  ORF Transcript_16691/g.56712 Transcript_16691/m.56712 type:complete len:222 (-) Transcript_16691:14-679(-)
MSTGTNDPTASMSPTVRGMTSIMSMSWSRALSTPDSTAARIARPWATASSALTDVHSSVPAKSASMADRTAGMRVAPPTMTTSVTSAGSAPASLSAPRTSSTARSTDGAAAFSKAARVTVARRSPTATSASSASESASLAAWHARSSDGSAAVSTSASTMPSSRRARSKTTRSKVRPPRSTTPRFPSTRKVPSSMCMSVTSVVPPPMSNTAAVLAPATKSP